MTQERFDEIRAAVRANPNNWMASTTILELIDALAEERTRTEALLTALNAPSRIVVSLDGVDRHEIMEAYPYQRIKDSGGLKRPA